MARKDEKQGCGRLCVVETKTTEYCETADKLADQAGFPGWVEFVNLQSRPDRQ
jgi:hypothetical protein